MSDHSFNPFIAQAYGVFEAIVINSFIFWTRTNAAKNKNFHEGRYWSYGTPEFFTQYFPYFKEDKMRAVLESCIKKGVLIKSNFNKVSYDRTSWYSLSDKILNELGLDKTCLKPAPAAISQKSEMDLVKNGNAFPKNQTPIPDTKTSTETYIKPNITNAHAREKILPTPKPIFSKGSYHEGGGYPDTLYEKVQKAVAIRDANIAKEESQQPVAYQLLPRNQNLMSQYNITQLDIARFEMFWNLYPKKISKAKCQVQWFHDKCHEVAEDILDKLYKQINECSIFGDNFAPSPLNYITGERWNDDIQKPILRKSYMGKKKTNLDEKLNDTDWRHGVR